MHDMLGSAGMLRGWIAMWTMQMLWFVLAMTVTVGATAIGELLHDGYVRRARDRLSLRVPVIGAGQGERRIT